MDIITYPLGWILKCFHMLVGNYGVSIILFTIFIKMVLLPLTVKQQRSMMKTQKLQPLLNELQKKYANDKEKLSKETMKLYQKYQVNPMSGCLPLLIQMPILFALYWVVRAPITYLMGFDPEEFWRITNALTEWGQTNQEAIANLLTACRADSIEALAANNFQLFKNSEIVIARFLQTYPEIMENHWITGSGKTYELVNFMFLGIDLSQTPSLQRLFAFLIGQEKTVELNAVLLWLIPILSGLSSWASMKVSQAMQGQPAPKVDANGEEMPNAMKSMNLFMPFISAWFAFTLPAAIGLYWVVSNLLQMLQQVLLKKMIKIDLTDEQIKGEIVNVEKSRKKRKK